MNRSNLLFALDEDGHTHGRIAFPDLQRRRVNSDPGLIISGAAAEQAPGALCRLERRGFPELVRAGRLDVVMRIEQNRRSSGRPWSGAEHGRMRAVDLEQLDVTEPGTLEPGRSRLCRLSHPLCGRLIRADRRDADETLQVCADTPEGTFHSAPDRVQA